MKPDSPLVAPEHVIESPNRSRRKYKIDTIIIHCMAGTYDAKRCGQMFADKKRAASSHYGISSNGEIWQYVPESFRAWTTGGNKK
jgi:Negative regulator of beta-lactamase expression